MRGTEQREHTFESATEWNQNVDSVVVVDESAIALPPSSLDWAAHRRGCGRDRTSVDAPEECYTSDGGTTTSDAGSDVLAERRSATASRRRLRRRRSRDVGSGKVRSSTTSLDNESLETPDSLLTSELLDDSIFDGELDLIGACRPLFEHAGLTCYTLLSPSITFHCFTRSSEPTSSEISSSTLFCFCLSDWSHGSRPFTGLICSSVLCYSSISVCFSYS